MADVINITNPLCVGYVFNTTTCCCNCTPIPTLDDATSDPFELDLGAYTLIGPLLGLWASPDTLTILGILCLFVIVLAFSILYPFAILGLKRVLLLLEGASISCCGQLDEDDDDDDAKESRRREVLEGLPRMERIEKLGCCYCLKKQHPNNKQHGIGAVGAVGPTKTAIGGDKNRNECCLKFLRFGWKVILGIRLSEPALLIILGFCLRYILHYITRPEPEINEHLAFSFNPDILDYFFWPPMMLAFGLGAPIGLLWKHAYTIITSIVCAFVTTFGGGFLMFLAAPRDRYNFMDGLFLGVILSTIDLDAIFGIIWFRETNSRLEERFAVEGVIRDMAAFTLFVAFEGYSWEVGRDAMKLGDIPTLLGLFLARFILIWIVSAIIGVIIGIASTLLSRLTFKNSNTYLQPGIVLVFGYLTVALSEMVLASGALGMLFYSFVIGRFLREDMSEDSRTTLGHLLRLMEDSFNGIIYVTIGMTLAAGFALSSRMDWPLVFAGVGIFYVLRIITVVATDIPHNLIFLCARQKEKMIPWWEIAVRGFCWTHGASTFYMAFVMPDDEECFPRAASIVSTTVLVIFMTVFIQGSIANVLLALIPIDSDELDLEASIEAWKGVLDSLERLIWGISRESESRKFGFLEPSLRQKSDDAISDLRHRVESLRDWILDEFESDDEDDGDDEPGDEELQETPLKDAIQPEVDPELGIDEKVDAFDLLKPETVELIESLHSLLDGHPDFYVSDCCDNAGGGDTPPLLHLYTKLHPDLLEHQSQVRALLAKMMNLRFEEAIEEPEDSCLSTLVSRLDCLRLQQSHRNRRAVTALFEIHRMSDSLGNPSLPESESTSEEESAEDGELVGGLTVDVEGMHVEDCDS